MNASFEQEAESLSCHYSEWNNIFRKHFQFAYESDDEKDDLTNEIEVSLEVHNVFETILKFFTRCGQFKDTWHFPARLHVFLFGQLASVRSEKMGVEFDFGIDHSDFFLSSELRYPSHIRNVDDKFWAHLIGLQSIGRLEFLENIVPSWNGANKAMKVLKNAKSSLFQVIRNYILLEMYQEEASDLGSLEIKWPVTASWDLIIKNGLCAFDKLYKINYMLYRIEYLRCKGKIRRNK